MAKLYGILAALVATFTYAQIADPDHQQGRLVGLAADEQAEVPSAEGPLCLAAILELVSEYGRRCIEEEDPAFRELLDHSNSLLGNKFLSEGWSLEKLAAFRAQMGAHGEANDKFCRNDGAMDLYHSIKENSAKLADGVAKELRFSGEPQWGTCL